MLGRRIFILIRSYYSVSSKVEESALHIRIQIWLF